MAKKCIPLHLVTLFHPEYWLQPYRLESLPCIKRDRPTLEHMREEVARARGLDIHYEHIHGSAISNLGRPIYSLRETWMPTDKLADCLEEFDVRLIYTIEERSQQRYRLEFRPDWVDQPGSLDEKTNDKLTKNIRDSKKVSVRQLWINPVAGRFEPLPLEVLEEIAKETANLVLGPFDVQSTRKADLDFETKNEVWWLLYSE